MKQKLTEMLLAGNSKFNTDVVATYIGTDEFLFKELINLIINGKPTVPQRAVWVMSAITDKYSWIIQPYLSKIFDSLPSFSHPSLARNILRLISKIELPVKKTGQIFEYCYNCLNDVKQPVAIRVHAMQILYNISEKEPALKNELKLVIESHLYNASTGFANRANKLLKKL